MLTLDKIYHASFTLKSAVYKTEMINALSIVSEGNLFLKAENLQKTGSFKVRGSYYKISQLNEEERKKGIVACSAGNHAQGVALAAKKNNIKATIFIPDGAPISKVEATRSYGAEVILIGETYTECYEAAVKYCEEAGSTFIHPFDDDDVIAGQGTIGLEVLEQLPNVDVVLVPIGGGGLISGVAYAIKQLKPECKVIGVQAERANSMYSSIKNKKLTKSEIVSTFADGVAVKLPGEKTFGYVSEYVDEIVTVSEDEIATAILVLLEKQKLICEGAGALSVAAVLSNKIDVANKNICCVLSGGNIDVNILSRVINRGLLNSGRTSDLIIALTDKPGQLEGVSKIIATNGGNVIGVYYDQGEENSDINSCILRIKMETRNFKQINDIKQALEDNGFCVVNKSH